MYVAFALGFASVDLGVAMIVVFRWRYKVVSESIEISGMAGSERSGEEDREGLQGWWWPALQMTSWNANCLRIIIFDRSDRV